MMTVWTVGHSTRMSDEFLDLLKGQGIEQVADVRSFPGSRRYPQFNEARLRETLAAAGISYVHIAELGGRRPARPDSRNLAWRNASFRGYADYMDTQDFRAGVDRLLDLARAGRTAIMCAEAVWWRCHRSLIADHLKSVGVRVIHILGPERTEDHPYTGAARLSDGRLTYEPPPGHAELPFPEGRSSGGFGDGNRAGRSPETGRTAGRRAKAGRPVRGRTSKASKG